MLPAGHANQPSHWSKLPAEHANGLRHSPDVASEVAAACTKDQLCCNVSCRSLATPLAKSIVTNGICKQKWPATARCCPNAGNTPNAGNAGNAPNAGSAPSAGNARGGGIDVFLPPRFIARPRHRTARRADARTAGWCLRTRILSHEGITPSVARITQTPKLRKGRESELTSMMSTAAGAAAGADVGGAAGAAQEAGGSRVAGPLPSGSRRVAPVIGGGMVGGVAADGARQCV